MEYVWITNILIYFYIKTIALPTMINEQGCGAQPLCLHVMYGVWNITFSKALQHMSKTNFPMGTIKYILSYLMFNLLIYFD